MDKHAKLKQGHFLDIFLWAIVNHYLIDAFKTKEDTTKNQDTVLLNILSARKIYFHVKYPMSFFF